GTACVWDAGAELAVLRGHEGVVVSAAFDPSGRRIATASRDGTARLWDAATGVELAVLRRHEGEVVSAAFDQSGKRIATASHDGTARVWDAESGDEITEMRHEEAVVSVAFDPSGRRIATASYDGTARVWDAESGEQLAVLRHQGPIPESDGASRAKQTQEVAVRSAVFDPSGRRIATVSHDDGTVRLWDANGAEQLIVLPHKGVQSAAFDPSGARVATASDDGTAFVWDTASGALLAKLRGHAGSVASALFDPSATLVVTASDDRTARVWDADTGDQLAKLPHDEAVNSAVFDPSGARIATASNDKTARVWDAASGQELAVYRGHEGWVAAAVFDPSGTRLTTASDDATARVWKVMLLDLQAIAYLTRSRILYPDEHRSLHIPPAPPPTRELAQLADRNMAPPNAVEFCAQQGLLLLAVATEYFQAVDETAIAQQARQRRAALAWSLPDGDVARAYHDLRSRLQ
ncbi:MAG: WD40 repeat domain-containing protein, partial [Minisyncoccia bacterium]